MFSDTYISCSWVSISEVSFDGVITEFRYDSFPVPTILAQVQSEPLFPFCTSIYTFSTVFFVLWVKIEDISFC